ncbi:hypothetical protein [Rhodoferax sp.]|uniref:hypothetical protein n=1 Tax=Rhodoferax sp. TaxID=50421 RepID=UPI00272A4DCF|nr:hypothetical protein [Rhodoferax sp.]
MTTPTSIFFCHRSTQCLARKPGHGFTLAKRCWGRQEKYSWGVVVVAGTAQAVVVYWFINLSGVSS